jgi:hypothetical protein
MRTGLLVAFGSVVALVAPSLAHAGPGLVVGAVEDDVRASTAVEAEARMAAFRLDGFRAVRVTSYWRPGRTSPTDEELAVLRNVSDAGMRNGVQVFVTVMSPGSATTPLTTDARTEFASYAAAIASGVPSLTRMIVGNEPNLNRFWLPQFNLDGSSAAPAAYLSLLARTYDAVKETSPDMRIYGGAVSPRGTDRPDGARPTHSPTTFIQGMGAAYRASGRERPVMDALSIHVYGDNSSVAPTVGHPLNTSIGVADYDKLVRLLGEAFDGTAQPGSDLPILYGEYGVESEIPAAKAELYTGTEPATTKPVSESTQAAYYRQALALAFCQPNVEGLLLFLSNDERGRANWQSGIHYVDGTPKSSRALVTRSLDRTAGGSVTRCPGLELPVHTSYLRFGTRSAAKRGVFRASFRCDLDCRYLVRLENAVTHAPRLAASGSADIGEVVQADLGTRRLKPGTYRYTLRLVHPVNPGAPTVRTGPRFVLP